MDRYAPQGGSRLSSSSKFLNQAGLRDWCGTEMLRKNGRDLPPPAGIYQAVEMLNGLRDIDHMEALITEERKRWPTLDAWYDREPSPPMTRARLQACPKGSVGALLLDYVDANNFELELVNRPPPTTQWARFIEQRRRYHDVEHLIAGGGFDYMGELVVYYFEMAQVARFFSPELGGEVQHMYIFGALRYMIRTVLNYAPSWPTAMACMRRGHRIGVASDCLLLADYDSALPLSLAEARATLGVRAVEDVDTSEMSWLWGAESHKALVAAGAARVAAAAAAAE
jgi:ubiquinone biosynthesis protein COQ4